MSRTLMLIDGSSLLHRAFYALPLLKSTSGQYTNAVYGFMAMLVRLLGDVKPDAIIVAFDKGKATFRSDVYKEYKAQRKATPPELAEQFPIIREALAAMGIAVFEQEGFEADDILGTFCKKGSEAGYQVHIVTGDKDALQLIGANAKVLLTRKGITEIEMIDEVTLKEAYGLTPGQVVDLKGLMGDTSDNIPGVPGVGEKTAQKLIAEFGTVENVLANVDKVSGTKLKENLRKNAELALLSKKLATIVCDLPLSFDPDQFRFQPVPDKVRDMFTRLEFKSLLARLGDIIPDLTEVTVEVVEKLPEAEVLAESGQVAKLTDGIMQAKAFVCYPLLNGHIPETHFGGLGLSLGEKAVFVPAGAPGWHELLTAVCHVAANKIVYDSKAFLNTCSAAGYKTGNVSFDVSLAAYLLDPTASNYALTGLSERYLDYKNNWQEKEVIHDVRFACWAADTAMKLFPVLKEKLEAAQLTSLFYDIEVPLAAVLSGMEMAGIKIDREHLKQINSDTSHRVEELLAEINSLAGEEFNVNSPKQLGYILFEKLCLPVIKKTKTGYSTDAEVLEKLAGEHTLIDRLLEYRLLSKLKSTYLDAMEALIHPRTGRIHSSFNQAVTATGRLSSSDPNLQNIPIRTEAGRRIRELFVPGEGYDYLVSADYSQIELRILAHLSGDQNLIEAFVQNQDIHSRTAAEVFGVPMNSVTGEMRARAKAVNFGIVYGISDYGLSRDIGVSRKEAGLYIDNYFARYQGVKEYIDNVVRDARRDGYVTTIFGRRRYLPDINSSNFNQRSFAERTAMNTPIQGTAADIIKKAMIDVTQALAAHRFKSRILLQVHDELVLEVPADELETVTQVVKTAMENTIALAVPLIADIKAGVNWAAAK
ncbi:MAG: DNA polymerase I [Negativicutes bacterium]|nr:DNA polymerase I [Negativicutes bacterium]